MWARIKGKYDYKYEVNENGEIRRFTVYCNHCYLWSNPQVIKGSIGNHGYKIVSLKKEGKFQTTLLHRLIAETFIPNPDNKQEVNHKNGDRTDTRVSNLEWVTRSENELHSYRMLGRKGSKPHKNKFGEEHHSSKKVYQFTTDGLYLRSWGSTMDIERQTGFNNAHISKCCRGEYNHVGGYIWRYNKAFEILENKLKAD